MRSDMRLPRTKIKLNPIKRLTTFNAQELIPVGVFEVIPGSTWNCSASVLCRMSTPKLPVMDDAFVEYYAFYVPMRLVWDDCKAFFGENSGAWFDSSNTYEIPQLTYPAYQSDLPTAPAGFDVGSVADYLGIPIYVHKTTPTCKTLNALPARAYVLIWNKYFRDQNYMPEAYFPMSSNTTIGYGRYYYEQRDGQIVRAEQLDPWLYAYRGSTPLPVCRFHDYFSDVFPSPQKGPEALIPASSDPLILGAPEVMRHGDQSWTRLDQATGSLGYIVARQGGLTATNAIDAIRSGNYSSSEVGQTRLQDLMGNINDLRLAVAIQRYYETNLGGTRFDEYIRNHFGVEIGDARIQIPELIGHGKARIGMTQVAQTSSTDGTSPQGHLAAYSLTADKGNFFNKTFVEPGYVMVLACVRPARSYGQGVPALFRRRDLFDLYDPKFAYIGMTPVYKSEIYESTSTANDSAEPVWGYKQAWSSYLDFPRTFTGYMRPQGDLNSTFDMQSLYYWHYGDSYASAPTMGSAWLTSGAENVDRTLAVSSSVSHQMIFDMTLNVTMTAPIPLDRRPGLMDHF